MPASKNVDAVADPVADARITALAAELRPALLRLTRSIRNQRVDTSITLTHLAALVNIDNNQPISASELAASERVQPPSMTKILATLETKGLIKRERHPTDGRQMIITTTAAGSALIGEERHARDAWLCRALAQLSEADLALLHQVRPVLESLATL